MGESLQFNSLGLKSFLSRCRAGDVSPALRELRGVRVLGINPPVYDFAWFDLWSKPVGLLTLLQTLRLAGNEVDLIDCLYEGRTKPMDFGRWKVERTPVEKPEPYASAEIPRNYYRFGLNGAALEKRLASRSGTTRPDVIFVTSGMTYWYPGVFEVVKKAKTIFPDVPVVLGGIYARLCPEHAAQSGADFIQTEPFSLSYSSYSLPLSLPWCSQDVSPALDLYDAPSYGVLITSWGCPLGCEYCAARKLWPGFAQRRLEDVFADLAFQTSLPTVTDMAFYDDALLLDKERHFYPLCRHIRERYPALRLHTPNGLHVAQLDDECCRTLFDTGFRTLRLSLEGTDNYTAKAGSGKTTVSDYARAVESLLRAGYREGAIETYILAGLPGQYPADIRASIETVKKLGGRPKLAEFSPIPGTPLYEKSLELTPRIADEPLLHNNTVYAPYVAKTLSPRELQNLKDLAAGRE
ncbi:MAG: cobalamin-dependent protein [Synergistaceae bacterium]|nr:cobalamin-dependent protein [Synergistaceae bacterium]